METMNRKVAISPEAMTAIIENNSAAVADALREVENNFVISTKAHITYHEHLMKMADESGDFNSYMHHSVMKDTYESILRNYEASRRYASA
jgi:hypothetical protein